MILLTIIFYFSSAIVASLILYPLFAWLRALFFPDPVRKQYGELHPVSIIIACRNEESCIAQKIDSFLDKDEWIEGSELIVISNGSSDGTDAILNRYASDQRVRVIFESADSSKIRSVNRGVRESRHDLLVFSDCRQTMKKGSVKELVANFSDPRVGTVNSVLTDNKNGKFSFRSLLNFIARCESLSGSSLNVFGALYAQRKNLFREFPVDLLFDDLFVVVSTLGQRYRLVTEAKAMIYDISFEEYYSEDRIQRLARGLLIFLFNHGSMILDMPFFAILRFIVFKYLKLLLPFAIFLFCLAALLMFYLGDLPDFFSWLFIALAFTYLIEPLRRLQIHFLRVNYNFMVATIKFVFFNHRSNKWNKLKVPKAT